jgi:hypothetical protein
MDDDADLERRRAEWHETKARSLELLARCNSPPATVAERTADDALTLWCAERPAPRDIGGWLARCPEPSMMTAPPARAPQPTSTDSHRALREAIVSLERQVAALHHELAAVRAEASDNVATTAKGLCEEVGRLTGEVEVKLRREIAQLRKRIEDSKPKR